MLAKKTPSKTPKVTETQAAQERARERRKGEAQELLNGNNLKGIKKPPFHSGPVAIARLPRHHGAADGMAVVVVTPSGKQQPADIDCATAEPLVCRYCSRH